MRESGFRQMASGAAVRLASLALAGLWSVAAGALDSKLVDPNALRVLAFRGPDRFVVGSGVAIGATGLVLIANQLVRNADRLVVLDGGLDVNRFGREASLRAASPDLDLAVIEVPGLQRPGLPISASPPGVGAKVATVMFPGNVGAGAALPTPGTHAGTVAALVSAPLRGARPVALIQHDAAPKDTLFPGPLVDDCDRIVGFTVTGGPAAPGSTARFAVAGGELARFLEAEQLPFTKAATPCPATPAGTASTPPAAARPNAALVREAQALLNGLGFDAGTPDGVAGPRTTTAVTAFQKTAALAPNGQIDEGLVKALRTAAAARAQRAPQPTPPVQATATAAAPVAQPEQAALPPPATAPAWPYALGGAAVALAGAGLLFLVIWSRRRPRAPRPLDRASKVLRDARDARDGTGGPESGPGGRGWIFEGSTPDGRAIHLVVHADAMASTVDGIVIGRSAQLAGLVVEDPSVSRSHARITLSPDGLAIEDLQSTNGTQVNGVAMPAHRPTPLAEGATVTLGDVNMRLARA